MDHPYIVTSLTCTYLGQGGVPKGGVALIKRTPPKIFKKFYAGIEFRNSIRAPFPKLITPFVAASFLYLWKFRS